MFEVKRRARKRAAVGTALFALLLLVLGIRILLVNSHSSDYICTSSFLLFLSMFFLLISGGLMVSDSVRIGDESVMFLRGTSIDSEVRLDDIEKVEVLDRNGNMKIDIYADGERKMSLGDFNIGGENLRALLEELEKLSEKHHFPVIEKESALEKKKEEALEKREMALGGMEESYGHLSRTSDEDLPYRVK